MDRKITSNRSRQHGAVIVFVVIVLLILIGIIGLAVDWGYMTWTAQKLQTAADAAALAGAQQLQLNQTAARTAAVNFASLNEAGGTPVAINANTSNSATGDVVIGKYDTTLKTFTATTATDANAVRVVARRTTGSTSGALPLFFGPIFQKNTAEVARYGIAFSKKYDYGNAMIALNATAPSAFKMQGNPTFDAGQGGVFVNSNSTSGASFGGSPNFIAKSLDVVGNYSGSVPSQTQVRVGVASTTDPYAGLPVPSFTPVRTPSQITGTATFNPGYYSGGLNLKGQDKVVLNPGVYILGGNPAFNMNSNNTKVTGYGVVFYIVSGAVSTNGGTVNITPPPADAVAPASDYIGIQFFQARNNTSTASFGGNGLFTGPSGDVNNGAGVMYFPKATVSIGGTADKYVNSIVADQLQMSGNGKLYLTKGYVGGGTTPAKVYIVE